ncbi:MAG TPA: hypothetical protein VGD42_14710 [Lysobacter sp.]
MNSTTRVCAATLVVLSLAGCHSAMSSNSHDSTPREGFDNSSKRWPLEFRVHYFGWHCFDTLSCEVSYSGWASRMDEPSPSVASYGRPLEDLLSAGRGPIVNFPPPALVSWRSRDGMPHHAEVDIGAIFKDQRVRHNVSREDVTEHGNDTAPKVVLEVNDRTINVYMRATIWTKQEQIPGNPLSHSRDDLIKVYSRTY